MNMKLVLILSMIISNVVVSEARIVNRRVKESPKVCAYMKQDDLLSKPGKTVFGTLRNSVVLEDNISVVNDLGKKVCQWKLDQFQQAFESTGDLNQSQFYIDEYKNYIYPIIKDEQANTVKTLKISLSTCEVESSDEGDRFQEPKCEKPKSVKKNRKTKKTKVASKNA